MHPINSEPSQGVLLLATMIGYLMLAVVCLLFYYLNKLIYEPKNSTTEIEGYSTFTPDPTVNETTASQGGSISEINDININELSDYIGESKN